MTSERLLQLLKEAGKRVGLRELLRAGNLKAGAKQQLQKMLKSLVRQGSVEHAHGAFEPTPAPPPRDPRPVQAAEAPSVSPSGGGESRRRQERGRDERSPQRRPEKKSANRLEGTLHIHRDGFGFVHPSGQTTGENIYLPAHEARRALDNDRVEIELLHRGGGRTEGRLVRVVDRKRSQAVGVYKEEGRKARVFPRDRGLPPIRVPPTQMARSGDVVKVRLGIGAGLLADGEGLTGEVSGSLGAPGEPSQEVLSSAYAEGFQDEFPPEVMDEADAISLAVSEAEATESGRKDLRHLPLLTIDGEDARDFDDAVHARAEGGGWRLWVAIADVTHYVRRGSALDAEAYRRATSVYLPDRVLPMLPERLSNGICSLRPDEDRLCMVAELTLDAQAQLTSHQLYPGVMRSVARCTYGQVQDVLDGKQVPGRTELKPHFEALWSVAQALNAMRRRRGAIEFDLPETRVVVDPDGAPLRMERRERLNSHRLVEACMLAANEAVARYFIEEQLPGVFRHHGEPDEEKLALFSGLAQVFGFQLPKGAKGKVTPQALNQLLEQLEDHPERRALNQLLLRSMMQAAYSAVDVGHYGLGAEHYLHFTSPIRRYPDLLVHRLLKAHWGRKAGRSAAARDAEVSELQSMAEHCSDRERAAMRVERDVTSYYACLMMKDRVGEELDGTVSSLAESAFFVELDGLFVEGRARAESLGSGSRFDAARHALVYPTGRKLRVGQRLRVQLTGVNLERRHMDLTPVGFEGERPLSKPSATVTGKRRTSGDKPSSGSAHPGFDRLRAKGSAGGKKKTGPPKGSQGRGTSRSKGANKRGKPAGGRKSR